MNVKAKFKVESVTKYSGNYQIIEMNAVYEGSTANTREDKSFAESTPSGSIKISVTNPAILGHFVPGEVHYVTFEKTDV